MTQHVPEVSDTKSVETTFLAARTETSLPAETPESTGQRDIIMMGPEKIRTIQDSSHEAQVHRSSESPFAADRETSVQAQKNPVQVPSNETDRPTQACHVSHQPVEGPADRSGDAAPRLESFDVDRTEDGSSVIRTETSRAHIREGMGGPGLDQLHGDQVREQQSSQSPPPDPICGTDGREARTHQHTGATAASSGFPRRGICHDRRDFWTQIHPSKGQGHAGSIWSHSRRALGLRRGFGLRDVQPGDYGDNAPSSGSGVYCPPGSDSEHGECLGPCDPTFGEPGGEEHPAGLSEPESETIAESCLAMHQDVQDLHHLIRKITQEFQEVQQEVRPMGKPFLLGEIFCSSESPLTQQIQNMGQQAFRFGLAQGDLSTVNGRRKLFQSIACHRPIHLWYSPVCGPWSSWSALNASRSAETQWEYQQKRSELRYQIALGIVLYRYQVSRGLHFSWEQPQKSLMLLHQGINEIHQHTQVSQFDMCEAGDLRDPICKLHMKKRMQVVTTHEPIYRALHGLTCRKNHPHQQLEGSTQVHGHSILRTKFSEIYPRKFVRLV